MVRPDHPGKRVHMEASRRRSVEAAHREVPDPGAAHEKLRLREVHPSRAGHQGISVLDAADGLGLPLGAELHEPSVLALARSLADVEAHSPIRPIKEDHGLGPGPGRSSVGVDEGLDVDRLVAFEDRHGIIGETVDVEVVLPPDLGSMGT